MKEESKFPKLDGGWCDGMGCGSASICFCKVNLAQNEEFQRVFDKPWTKPWGPDADSDCVNWDKAWRLGYEVTKEFYEKKLKEMKQQYETTITFVKKNEERINEKAIERLKIKHNIV